jgi:hypothetical protein
LEAGGIFGTGFKRSSVVNSSASLSIFPHNDVGKTKGGHAELSTAANKRKRSKKKRTTITAFLASRTHAQDHIRS